MTVYDKILKLCIIISMILLIGCGVTSVWKTPNEIALTEINGMHFVKVTFNDSSAMLLFDTGASKSLLDISQAEEYNFKYTSFSDRQYIGLGGLADIHNVYAYRIQEVWISFLGADLTEIRSYFEKENMHIIGIIGSDFITTYNVIVDFKDNIMYLNN